MASFIIESVVSKREKASRRTGWKVVADGAAQILQRKKHGLSVCEWRELGERSKTTCAPTAQQHSCQLHLFTIDVRTTPINNIPDHTHREQFIGD